MKQRYTGVHNSEEKTLNTLVNLSPLRRVSASVTAFSHPAVNRSRPSYRACAVCTLQTVTLYLKTRINKRWALLPMTESLWWGHSPPPYHSDVDGCSDPGNSARPWSTPSGWGSGSQPWFYSGDPSSLAPERKWGSRGRMRSPLGGAPPAAQRGRRMWNVKSYEAHSHWHS